MVEKKDWDWEIESRVIVELLDCPLRYIWREEPKVSPDGEKIAFIINEGENKFSVCQNKTHWEEAYDKVWSLKYGPDGRLSVLALTDEGRWTVVTEQVPWENSFDFAWELQFSTDGSQIGVAIQNEQQYGMAVNDVLWPTLYPNANHFTLSPKGNHSAAVVQTQNLSQGDIFKYQEGVFSVAIDGQTWDTKLVNIWTPIFDHQGKHICAQCRTSLYTYTIVVDGKVWDKEFSSVWRPAFNPATRSCMAPVRIGKKWGLAQDGEIILTPRFYQMWNFIFSPLGDSWAAIVATDLGKWTVCINGSTWKTHFETLVYDITFSPDGQRIAAAGKNKDKWFVLVDDQVWNESFDMVFEPVFSPDSKHLAVKVEKKGAYTYAIDGKVLPHSFDQLWMPVFSPDSKKILLRGITENQYLRAVIPVEG